MLLLAAASGPELHTYYICKDPEVERIWGIKKVYQGSFKDCFYPLQDCCRPKELSMSLRDIFEVFDTVAVSPEGSKRFKVGPIYILEALIRPQCRYSWPSIVSLPKTRAMWSSDTFCHPNAPEC